MSIVLATGCGPPRRDLEGDVRAALDQRSWPATSVLVVEGDTVRLNLGHRTPPARDPQDLVYPLGSISKMFTAAALHRLAERGEVDLEAPVAQYLPTAHRGARRALAPSPRSPSCTPTLLVPDPRSWRAIRPRARPI